MDGMTRQSGTQIPDAAVPVAEAGGHDSCRHLDRKQGCSPGDGCEKVHVAVDDATRLAYVEVLPDEQQSTTVGLLMRAVGWFREQGMTCRRILSDSLQDHGDQADTNQALHTPQTNGKAERFIKTLLNEWTYAMPFQTSKERNR